MHEPSKNLKVLVAVAGQLKEEIRESYLKSELQEVEERSTWIHGQWKETQQ